MPIYPYSFQLPPLNVQDIPNDGVPGEFLGINVGGQLDWLPAGGGGGSGDMLAANNLSELTNFATARTNIGLGTTSTPTFANLTLTSPSLSSSAPVTISQTWNNAAVAFTGLKVNATSTNSAAGSLLLDLQVGGVSQFKVDKSGVATLSADGVPQLRMISVTGSGSVFNGLTLESSLSTLAGFLVNRSTGEVKIGGLSNAGYFPTFYSNNAERMRITTAGNVGIGTTSPTSKLHVAETWNNAGTAFTAMQVAVTNTNSAAGSKLFDLLSGVVTPTSKFSVDKDGIVSISAYAFGDYLTKTNKVRIGNNSSDAAEGVFIGSSSYLGFVTSSADPNLPSTSRLYGDGAHAIGQRNGANGQTFSVYGTYPNATAWERFTITAPTSGNVLLGTYKGTGGIARGLELQADGTTRMLITAAGAIIQRPLASVTPPENGDLVIEATSNTTLTFKLKGTDGTVRTGTITLA